VVTAALGSKSNPGDSKATLAATEEKLMKIWYEELSNSVYNEKYMACMTVACMTAIFQ